MNNITTAGRTVRVSKEVTFKRDGKKKDGKVTYVTQAVRHPGRDEDDFFTLRFFDGLSTIAQEQLNLNDPKKVADKNIKNDIYSRTFSVSGRLNVFTKEVTYEVEVEGVDGVVEFPIDETNVTIDVNELTLLDAKPEFARTKNKVKAKSKGGKVKAKVKKSSDNSSSQGTKIDDEDIPM